MNTLVFDIETVPDVVSGRRLYELQNLSDKDVAEIMFHKRREETGGSDFIRHHLQRIVAISAVLSSSDGVKVWSLGTVDSSEKDLIERFFSGLERYVPTLVSWNGSGFDLPVLHYRALLHGVAAPRYWDQGEQDRDFKWNNYLSRYHARHTDLMEVLSGFQPRANVRLDEIATMLGFPGKMGMSGAKVWGYFQDGMIDEIRDYCETDVLNTYLVFLRFEMIRGNLDQAAYDKSCADLREVLLASDALHLQEFAEIWSTSNV